MTTPIKVEQVWPRVIARRKLFESGLIAELPFPEIKHIIKDARR